MDRSFRIACLLASAVALLTPVSAPAASSAASDIPSDILLTWVRTEGASENDGGGAAPRLLTPAFADREGRPLYTYAKDTPGRSTCAAECLELWKPAIAPPGARASGDWSLVTRDDGTRQWAFRGQPLYSYVEEAAWEDDPYYLNGDDRRDPVDNMQPVAGHGVDGVWSVATADAAKWLKMPAGFSVLEIPVGPGQVVITPRNEPLYVFDRKSEEERTLPKEFKPYLASVLDQPVGDFTVVTRYDGGRQWAYQGKALYTHALDYIPGDLNGKGVAAGMEPAFAFRYFMPPQVETEKDEFRGGRLIEASTGQILYMRDRHYYGAVSFYVRPQGRGAPLIGKTLGTRGCDTECEREWTPFLAPRDAKPSGFWTIVERPDKRRQWAYRNFPLYTHPSEPPGSAFGADTWNVKINHLDGNDAPPEFSYGLVWRVAVP